MIPKCDVTDRMGTVEMGNVLSDVVHRRAKIACERLIAGDKAERPLNRPSIHELPGTALLSRGRVSLQFPRFLGLRHDY